MRNLVRFSIHLSCNFAWVAGCTPSNCFFVVFCESRVLGGRSTSVQEKKCVKGDDVVVAGFAY